MDLVEVRFPAAGKTVLVSPGTTLLAAAGMAGVEIVTGCTRGMCGTDAVRLLAEVAGGDAAGALAAPGEAEAGTLARMGVAADCRLACSAKLLRGVVTVLGDALA
jgi:ferredoxin